MALSFIYLDNTSSRGIRQAILDLMKIPRMVKSLPHPAGRRDWGMLLAGVLVTCAVFGVFRLIHNAQTPLRPEASSITSPWIPSTVKRWAGPIDAMALKYNVDPNAIAIIMTLESGGYSKADSGEAKGLMQITPLTAKDIAARLLKQPRKSYDLFNPRTSIEFGTAYLSFLRDQFGTANQGPTWNSTVELIAAGYNGGPGAANHLEQGKGLQDAQTVIYSRDAFNMWRERQAAKSPTYDRWLERGGSTLIDLAKAEKQ
jgi:soluble lytic murein transglycosylase-like protein